MASHPYTRQPRAEAEPLPGGQLWRRRVSAQRNTEYPVELVPSREELVGRLAERLGARRSLWVTTPTVHDLHAETLHHAFMELRGHGGTRSDSSLQVLPCSEQKKTLASVAKICDRAQELALERNSVLVAVGGGVLSDLVTMAANLYRRGIGHVRVPTTLLGVVDAAVGAKGAVNHGGKRNALGCFFPPESVHLHPEFCQTLPPRQTRSGLAEILKVALACDVELFERLEVAATTWHGEDALGLPKGHTKIIRAAVSGILDELEPNLFEDRTFERRMDLGHTFSPLLETASSFELLHGEAVAIDMSFTVALAAELGELDREQEERIHTLFVALGLPTHDPRLDVELCRHALRESIRHRGGEQLLFLPCGVGNVRCLRSLHQLDEPVLSQALERWRNYPR